MEKSIKKTITNHDFIKAYYGLPNDEKSQKHALDNRKIINSVLKRYYKYIPKEDLDSLGMIACWKALQGHKDNFGQKFTTSLYTFVVWECRKALKKINRTPKQAKLTKQHSENISEKLKFDYEDLQERFSEIENKLSELPCDWMRQLIKQYFYENLTIEEIGEINGYGKTIARNKLKTSLGVLKQIALENGFDNGV